MRTKSWKHFLHLFFIMFPLVFTVLVFGYLPPRYEVVLYTDNIVGEGILTAYVNKDSTFSPFYEVGVYFGSQLKKATISDIRYNVSHLGLVISDVSEAELDRFDVRIFGLLIGRYELEDKATPGEYNGVTVSLSEDNERLHLSFANPETAMKIELNTHFAPTWFWIAYCLLLLLVSALLALLFMALTDMFPTLLRPLLGASCIVVSLLAGAFFCGSMAYVDYTDFLLNWLLLYAVSLLLNAFTLPWLGSLITMLFTTFWYAANYFIILFRNKPIMLSDLRALGTAAEVANGYSFMPPWEMLAAVAVVGCYAYFMLRLGKEDRNGEKQPAKARLLRRGMSAAAAVILIAVGINTPAFKSLNSFAWDAMLLNSFHKEGMVLTFLKGAMNAIVREPEGYSADAVGALLTEYEATGEERESGVQPTNIIMVMNEAFSDLRTVGMEEKINVMPFIDSLRDNTVQGSLYVSIYGGGTCNTEFEALTGNTLAFLGTGAYPYTENVTKPLFSLASYFAKLGYTTDAFHANKALNWNRNRVYPNLGFQRFHAEDEYPPFAEDLLLHGLPADIADYLFMETVDKENRDSPRFLFNVTMQNHADYKRWEDVEPAEAVTKYGSTLYPDAQIYLSLVKASDDALRQLIETFRDSEEPTMIIFFGDHQPGLSGFAREGIYSNSLSYLDYFKTKFFIWTNYETESMHDVSISANYLPWLILKQGNFQLPPYVQMLEEVHEKYPIISSQGVIDIDGNVYTGVAEVMDDPLIQKYQYIQYANLFDEIDPAWFEVK